MKTKQRKGFAVMDPEQVKAIARKGGEAISQNRDYMAEIGRRGGEKSGQNRKANANKKGTTPKSS